MACMPLLPLDRTPQPVITRLNPPPLVLTSRELWAAF
jgi:hypothetical protein